MYRSDCDIPVLIYYCTVVDDRINFHGLSRLGKRVRFCQKILLFMFVLINSITLNLVLCFYILICEIFISPYISKRVLVLFI